MTHVRLLMLGTVALAAGCSRVGGPTAAVSSEPPPVWVTTAAVEARPIQRAVAVVGTFHGNDEVPLAVKVDGRVKRIFFEKGAVVKPGDVLLELDDTDLALAVEEAKRGLETELAKLAIEKVPEGDFDVEQVPSVSRANFTLVNAQRKHDRARGLRSTGGMSKDDYEQCETDFRVAQAAKLEAVTNARSTLASARLKAAALATAEQRLRDAKLCVPTPLLTVRRDRTHPVEYVIADRMVAEGQQLHAAAGRGVFRLVMDQPLKLMANVPERYYSEVKLGQTVRVHVEAYPGETFEGEVTLALPTVDSVSRTFQVEVTVPNEPRRLKAGGFGKASILTRVDPKAKTVPIDAIHSFAGVNKVFVVKDGKAKAVEVRTGVEGTELLPGGRAKRWVEVTGELAAGDEVATSGQTQLVEGSAVKVR